MRFLKPLLAGAALLTLVAPAAASAEPYFFGGHDGGRGDYHARDYGDYHARDYGDAYRRDDDRGDRYERWGRHYERDGWRYHFHFWRHHDWRDGRDGYGWR